MLLKEKIQKKNRTNLYTLSKLKVRLLCFHKKERMCKNKSSFTLQVSGTFFFRYPSEKLCTTTRENVQKKVIIIFCCRVKIVFFFAMLFKIRNRTNFISFSECKAFSSQSKLRTMHCYERKYEKGKFLFYYRVKGVFFFAMPFKIMCSQERKCTKKQPIFILRVRMSEWCVLSPPCLCELSTS